jgi:hypothetical protein
MKLHFTYEPNELPSNIGVAKALIESRLTPKDLLEISSYLNVYALNREEDGEKNA